MISNNDTNLNMFSHPPNLCLLLSQPVCHYSDQEKQVFKNGLLQPVQELPATQETFADSIESYVQYKTLQDRQKRSLLPFVTEALNFLFGTVADSDLRAV